MFKTMDKRGEDASVLSATDNKAVDVTWGFKKEYYQLSMKVAEPLFEKVDSANPDYAVSDCPLSGLQDRAEHRAQGHSPHPDCSHGLRTR